MLLCGLALVLLALFGLCFGVGYSMGSSHARNALSQSPQTVTSAPVADPNAQSKPAAAPPLAATPQPGADQTTTDTATTTPGSDTQSVAATTTQEQTATGNFMVQIATVSHLEDADVLLAALRKRGYAVTVALDPTDQQYHVRIGPFATRQDADAAHEKLINDGYNAIVQPPAAGLLPSGLPR